MITHSLDKYNHLITNSVGTISNKISSTISYSINYIAYLLLKSRHHASFSPDQVRVFSNQALVDSNQPDIENIVRSLLSRPGLLNKRISTAFKLYHAERNLFGKTDLEYEEGLNKLSILSFGLSKIKPVQKQNELSKKINHILSISDLDHLSEADKLKKNDFYLLYLAHKSHEIFLELKNNKFSNSDLDNYFNLHKDFFDNNDKLMERCWKEIDLDNKSILFFINREYQKTMGNSVGLFEKICEFVRRGPAIHTALINRSKEKEAPKQIHITINCYEENPLRIIDLLSSHFVSLDLTKFLSDGGSNYLKEIYDSENFQTEFDQLWESTLSSILKQPSLFYQIKNSFFRRAMCVLKWFGMSRKSSLHPHTKPQKMICSEFVINLIGKILNEMEETLINKYEAKTNQTLSLGAIINNPFTSMKAYNMTPGDAHRVLSQFQTKRVSGSTFLEKIIDG